MMIWAAYICLKNDGIDWRGTHYLMAQLRSESQMSFFKVFSIDKHDRVFIC